MTDRPRLAITLGDPRGIGPEVTAGALARAAGVARVTLVGAEDQIAAIPAESRVSVGLWGRVTEPSSRPDALRAGQLAGHSIQRAVELTLRGEVDAIVTGPVEKHALHLAGFPFPGQTEWLGRLAGGVETAMMLVAGPAEAPLRVVLITTHIALRDVPTK